MARHMTRRGFIGGLAGAGALLAGGGLLRAGAGSGVARLGARPGRPGRLGRTSAPGLHELGLGGERDGVLSVPPGYRPARPVPLMVMLHGALGRTPAFSSFCGLAAESGIAALQPDSRGRTWDLVLGGYGPDVAFLDRALAHVFARLAVDPRRLALAGFSDGASYALSLGLPNGDLFTHVLAFSPGFMEPPARQGRPAVWVSHGTRDEILPVEASRGRIVPQLKRWGYEVRYREFDGGHTVAPELGREAFRWFLS